MTLQKMLDITFFPAGRIPLLYYIYGNKDRYWFKKKIRMTLRGKIKAMKYILIQFLFKKRTLRKITGRRLSSTILQEKMGPLHLIAVAAEYTADAIHTFGGVRDCCTDKHFKRVCVEFLLLPCKFSLHFFKILQKGSTPIVRFSKIFNNNSIIIEIEVRGRSNWYQSYKVHCKQFEKLGD